MREFRTEQLNFHARGFGMTDSIIAECGAVGRHVPPRLQKWCALWCPTTDDRLRVIYIKSYKVASTTTATIFQRIAEERGLRVSWL